MNTLTNYLDTVSLIFSGSGPGDNKKLKICDASRDAK